MGTGFLNLIIYQIDITRTATRAGDGVRESGRQEEATYFQFQFQRCKNGATSVIYLQVMVPILKIGLVSNLTRKNCHVDLGSILKLSKL